MRLFRVMSVLIISLVVLTGCMKSEFEEFVYESCNLERKLPNATCECYAEHLDTVLSDQEKSVYKKTVANPFAGLELLGIVDKLQVPTKCL